MRDVTDDLSALRKRVDEAHAYLQIDAQRERLAELEAEASKPGLWDDPDEARRVTPLHHEDPTEEDQHHDRRDQDGHG